MAKSGFATGFAGFLIGVVTGLGIAAGAMLVIAKSPVPFVDKVDRVTADVVPAAKLAGGVDPNARLNQQNDAADASQETGSVRTVTVAGNSTSETEKTPASAQSFWVQVGSFSKQGDAETSAANLAMQGIGARIRQSGPYWRVRVGPFASRTAAQEVLNSLSDQGLNPVIVQDKQ